MAHATRTLAAVLISGTLCLGSVAPFIAIQLTPATQHLERVRALIRPLGAFAVRPPLP